MLPLKKSFVGSGQYRFATVSALSSVSTATCRHDGLLSVPVFSKISLCFSFPSGEKVSTLINRSGSMLVRVSSVITGTATAANRLFFNQANERENKERAASAGIIAGFFQPSIFLHSCQCGRRFSSPVIARSRYPQLTTLNLPESKSPVFIMLCVEGRYWPLV